MGLLIYKILGNGRKIRKQNKKNYIDEVVLLYN